jgi:hypothetical protein
MNDIKTIKNQSKTYQSNYSIPRTSQIIIKLQKKHINWIIHTSGGIFGGVRRVWWVSPAVLPKFDLFLF